jgi:transposase
MPWKESKPMDQRVQLIQDYEEGESISALAEVYGVARKTVYKWLARHASGGVAALGDRSRAPLHCPNKLSKEMIAAIIAPANPWKSLPRFPHSHRLYGHPYNHERTQNRNPKTVTHVLG